MLQNNITSCFEQQASNQDSTFHEENLLMSTADLFLAGTETTATTLRWGLIFMMNHPEIQGVVTNSWADVLQ